MGVVDRSATSNGIVGVTPPAGFSGDCEVRLEPRGSCWFTNSPQSVTAGGGVNLTFGQNSSGCGGNNCGGADCVAHIYVSQPTPPTPNPTPTPVPRFSVSGYVFGDVNRNGVKESTDENICSATVYLKNPAGSTVASYEIQRTNPGYYNFPDVLQESYRIFHEVPTGWTGTTPFLYDFFLNVNKTFNFGLWMTPQPPGTFSQNRPTASCAGVGQARMNLSWSGAWEAGYYKVIPQSSVRGWQPEINVGNVTGYQYAVPAGGPADESWEFTIVAVNDYGSRVANDNLSPYHSSYYLYGWVPVNCTSMTVPAVYGNTGCSGANSHYLNLWWGLPGASDNIIVTRTDWQYNSGIGNIPSWTGWAEPAPKANSSTYGYWVYYHSPTNLTDQSGRGFGSGWSPPGYFQITTSNCAPPGAFSHNAPAAFCAGSMDPRINLSWTNSLYATAYYTTPQSNIRGWFAQNAVGNSTGFQYDVPDGFWVNEGFDFTTVATNTNGAVSTTGGSSYYTHGWTIIPPCYPPQIFGFTQPPAARCQAVNDSKIDVNWSPSQYAGYYILTPQSNLRGVQPSINVGNVTGYTYTVPGGAPAYEHWEFAVTAYNPYGTRQITSGSSYYVYGWTPGPVCATPQITFTVNDQQYQVTVNSGTNGTPVTLAYTATNAHTCSTFANPAWGLSGGFPAAAAVSPWGPAYGAAESGQTPPLINNPPDTQSSGLYSYTLTCTNALLQTVNPAAASTSKTLNVNIIPNLSPYIQTTEGDVHTNRDIKVTP